MQDDRASQAVRLLEAVAGGEALSLSALRQWPTRLSEEDSLLSAGYNELVHFSDEEDRRRQDPTYDAKARQRMRNWAALIRDRYGLKDIPQGVE